MVLNLAINLKIFFKYHVNNACISQKNNYEDDINASKGSSGIEVFSPNCPAIAAFFHPLVMIVTAFADVKKLIIHVY